MLRTFFLRGRIARDGAGHVLMLLSALVVFFLL
jgi:hypothetical protein